MTEKILKGTLLVSLILVMAIGAPAMTRAETVTEVDFGSMFSDEGSFGSLMSGMPGLFSGFGGAGMVIGQIFAILADQFMNLTGTEIDAIPGLFILNATGTYVDNTTTYVAGQSQQRTYYPDYDYYDAIDENIESFYYNDGVAGYPYCEVTRTVTGDSNVTITTGMSVTIAIWDSDHTLVNTIDRIVKTVQKVYKIMNDPASEESKQQAAIKEAVSAIMYLLIHINDIITGDELILFNPITYTTVRVWGSFEETHAWKVDVWNSTYGTNTPVTLDPQFIDDMRTQANSEGNEFMSCSWMVR